MAFFSGCKYDYYKDYPEPNSEKLEVEKINRVYRDINKMQTNEIIIKCSMCNAPLASIMQFNPLNQRQYIPEKQSIVAKCCHCGDKSFPLEIEGKIGIGNTAYTLVMPRPYEAKSDDGEFASFDITQVIIDTEVLLVWN